MCVLGGMCVHELLIKFFITKVFVHSFLLFDNLGCWDQYFYNFINKIIHKSIMTINCNFPKILQRLIFIMIFFCSFSRAFFWIRCSWCAASALSPTWPYFTTSSYSWKILSLTIFPPLSWSFNFLLRFNPVSIIHFLYNCYLCR